MLIKKRFLILAALCLVLSAFAGCSPESSGGNSEESALSLSEPSADNEASNPIPEQSEEDDSEMISEEKDTTLPYITCDKSEYSQGETITVTFANTDSKDWVGFYAGSDEPGTVNSITWKYSEGSGTLTFPVSSLGGTGEFTAYLCDNDGYLILDSVTVWILDSDTADYGAKSAFVYGECVNGIRSSGIKVTPGSEKSLTYVFYWGKSGKRLAGYAPIKTVTHGGSNEFTVAFNDCMYMPSEADSVEVWVEEGNSAPLYASAPDLLKAPEGDALYKFNELRICI